jgi:hypothetical protein
MSRTLAEMVATARSEAREISPAQAAGADNDSELALIVDVREPGEYKDSHVPGAVNVPRGCWSFALIRPRRRPTLPSAAIDRRGSSCTARRGPGARSLLAAQTLSSMTTSRCSPAYSMGGSRG